MSPKVSRVLCVAMLTCGMFATSGAAQNSAAPNDFQLNLTGNFLTLDPGNWVSSGAFTDQGVIESVSKHEPNGNPAHVFNNLSVIETLSSNKGSFTWKFTRRFMPVPGDTPAERTTVRTSGAWQLTSGTGVYSGITGEGTFTGTVNFLTGDLQDTFTGHVRLSTCSKQAGSGIEVCRL